MSEEITKAESRGVIRIEVTVVYEDGFKVTQTSPDMIVFRRTGMSIVTPSNAQSIVKAVNVDALAKALSILDSVRADVEGTRPTEDQVTKARATIAEQQQTADRVARMMQSPQGPQGLHELAKTP